MIRKLHKKEEGREQSLTLHLYLLLIVTLFLSGCSQLDTKSKICSVVIEECQNVVPDKQSADVGIDEDVTFVLSTQNGCVVTGTDYEDATLKEADGKMILTLHQVRYSTVVTLQTTYRKKRTYFVNGGEGEDICEPVDTKVKNTRTEAFVREGYIQTGWNTKADGSGTHIGFGSRTNVAELYAEWEKETDSSLFRYENSGDGIRITKYTGSATKCVLPKKIEGRKVRVIDKGAFANQKFDQFICGENLQIIENGAFLSTKISELTLSDNLTKISDKSFLNCSIKILHLNAKRKPVYAGSYFSAFPDKCERLFSLKGKKMVLYSGSSARYGYDSTTISENFPQYQIVNMGTYAYTNAKPQLDIIRAAMSEGDILIEAPEFDAASQQFCEKRKLDRFFFALVEEDYKLLEYLDLREYENTFDAFGEYLYEHGKLAEKDYSYLAVNYDDDGNRIDYPTYNEYGDYTLIRPNSAKDEMHRKIPADYTTKNITQERIRTLNNELECFDEKGITVLFTYAPRNRSSLTEASTEEELEKLELQLRSELCAPVISKMEDYFFSGIYFYEIDNHLSDEGVELRTKQIVHDIKEWIKENE